MVVFLMKNYAIFYLLHSKIIIYIIFIINLKLILKLVQSRIYKYKVRNALIKN